MKALARTLILLCLAVVISFYAGFSFAQEDKCQNPAALSLDDINKCLDDLNRAREQSEKATKPVETQLNGISSRVSFIEKDLVAKEKSIEDGYKNLELQQEILNKTIRDYYIKTYYNSPLVIFLSASSASEITQLLAYQRAQTNQDKLIITNIVLAISGLEEKKISLEKEQKELVVVKEKLGKVVGEAKAYQAKLNTKISELSARQREILSQRLAALKIPRSAGTSARGCSDDRGIDPGFSPRIAFFTYGAPHRNGLNQYGARGRANANQSYTDMLNAYYTDFQLSDYNPDTQIIVDGTNEYGQTFNNEAMNLEEYTKHLYEMPTTWPAEALKAQAIAARTYALRIMKVHGKIQPNQGHQVVKKETNAQSWIDAVEQTRGKVMLRGGEPFLSEYASTHGGYILNLGKFDGSGGNPGGFSELNDRAYDKESPWFYCDWGSRGSYSNTAWLKPNEVADIVNTLLLTKADGGTGEHLYQTDRGNPAGTDTWDEGKVKEELKKRGITPYNNVSSISVSADFGGGSTSSVNISGDAGSTNFGGGEFKDRFNLRAPANIQIVGPLYNVETK